MGAIDVVDGAGEKGGTGKGKTRPDPFPSFSLPWRHLSALQWVQWGDHGIWGRFNGRETKHIPSDAQISWSLALHFLYY